MNIFKKTSPTSLWIVGGLVVLVGICWYLGGWSGLVTTWKQWRYLGQIENLKEAYRQDTYGATTPEGTLKLFIEAFQKGDVDLASKYFVVEKQEEYRDKIGSWIKLNKRDAIIATLSRTKLYMGEGGAYASMETLISDNDKIPYAIRFVKNEDIKVWKIIGM
ncbi:MAG: hypothetical protein AAB900_03060 [Patescibacteria group bacterium]